MTREELARLASRAFAVLMTAWAFVEMTHLPDAILGFHHHYGERIVLGMRSYLNNYYSLNLTFDVVRILLLILAAVWFLRSSPRVQRLFLGPGASPDQPPSHGT
jgi:hypothetical protein